MLIEVPVSRVPQAWDALMAMLRPAVDRDPDRTSWDLLFALMEGRMTAWIVETDTAQGAIVTRMDHLEGVTPKRPVAWIYYAGGMAGPDAKQLLRSALAEFELIAAAWGCREVRIGGRLGWKALFPDYETLRQTANTVELRKSLT